VLGERRREIKVLDGEAGGQPGRRRAGRHEPRRRVRAGALLDDEAAVAARRERGGKVVGVDRPLFACNLFQRVFAARACAHIFKHSSNTSISHLMSASNLVVPTVTSTVGTRPMVAAAAEARRCAFVRLCVCPACALAADRIRADLRVDQRGAL
jgi:hypothetical protein